MADKLITHGFLHCCTVCISSSSSPPHSVPFDKTDRCDLLPLGDCQCRQICKYGNETKSASFSQDTTHQQYHLFRGPRSTCLLRVVLDKVTCQPLHWVLWTDLDKLRHAYIGKGKCDYVFVDPSDDSFQAPIKEARFAHQTKGNGQ